jgi:pimeloyl-ACP methyl ester carboxylesterase
MLRYYNFRNSRQAYRRVGKGPVVVLLHGFLGNSNCWKETMEVLKKQYTVLAPDLLGHGKSEGVGYVHTMELMAEAVAQIISSLKIRKYHLLGHSMGGYVALALAEQKPDSLRSLILLNSTAAADDRSRKQSRTQFIDLVKQERKRALDLLIPTFFLPEVDKIHYKIRQYRNMAEAISVKNIVAAVEGMKQRRQREIILQFATYNYLIMGGEKDSILSYKELQNQARLNEQGSFILMKDTGHMAFWEEPGMFYKLLLQHLKNN